MRDRTLPNTLTSSERSVLRDVWYNMIHRCTRPSSPDFKRYGARGITVCDEWMNSFDCFVADMGVRPSSRHSLDRIDNSRGYSPENCRWADRRTQSVNRCDNVRIPYNGETLTAIEWARRFNISPSTMYSRIRMGWQTPHLFDPPREYRSNKAVP